jgi:hypothetical protein
VELAPANADRDALQRLRQRGQALLDRAMPAAALRRWRTGHAACALGFSGNHPRALDGLARLLTLDMRVIDLACIGFPLRERDGLPGGPRTGHAGSGAGVSTIEEVRASSNA